MHILLVFNREPQTVGTKQYTNLDNKDFGNNTSTYVKFFNQNDMLEIMYFLSFVDCGRFDKKIVGDNGTYLDGTTGTCTSVQISDRFVLTAAHCMVKL